MNLTLAWGGEDMLINEIIAELTWPTNVSSYTIISWGLRGVLEPPELDSYVTVHHISQELVSGKRFQA